MNKRATVSRLASQTLIRQVSVPAISPLSL